MVDTGTILPLRTGATSAWGTTTGLVMAIVPLFEPELIPPRRHRCSKLSTQGRTKEQKRLMEGTRFSREFCPCGAYRELLDGWPFGRWWDKNMARRDPGWLTRADREHEPFVRYT